MMQPLFGKNRKSTGDREPEKKDEKLKFSPFLNKICVNFKKAWGVTFNKDSLNIIKNLLIPKNVFLHGHLQK